MPYLVVLVGDGIWQWLLFGAPKRLTIPAATVKLTMSSCDVFVPTVVRWGFMGAAYSAT
jgi:hypothetical protein